MLKPGRNDPCPCGSGKKYKKCCIDKENTLDEVFADNDFKPNLPKPDKSKYGFTKKYNSGELLKILSLLQLQPQNHGKNIRIEMLVTAIANDLNYNEEPINYQALAFDLDKHCGRHSYEDPPEEFFTENITFVNGNNIVYPGIFSSAVEITQGHLYSLLNNSKLPRKFIMDVVPGILFLLHIHNEIAVKLNHTHRVFEESVNDKLFLPDANQIIKQKEYFSFSKADMEQIASKLQISAATIDDFVFHPGDVKIDFTNLDENVLFQKPFVFYNGRYILTMPTAELGCITDFLIRKAVLHKCLDQYIAIFAEDTEDNVKVNLRSIGWREVELNFPQLQRSNQLILKEAVYQFDTDKLAYVVIMNEVPGKAGKRLDDFKEPTKYYVDRITHISGLIKQKDAKSKLFLIGLINKSTILNTFYMGLNHIEGIDQQLALSVNELEILIRKWSFDRLTLWKYANHHDEVYDKITFGPYTTHLAKFNWYYSNHESFYDSDREPVGMMIFGFEIDSEIKRSAKLRLDKIGIPFLNEKDIGYIPCRRKEEYYPVYISDEFKFGYFRYSLLKYSSPIWIQSNTSRDFNAEVYMNAVLFWLNESYEILHSFVNQLGTAPIIMTLFLDKKFRNPEEWDLTAMEEDFMLNHKINKDNRSIEIEIPIQIINHLTSANNKGEFFLMGNMLDAIGSLIESLHLGSRLNNAERNALLSQAMPEGRKKMIIITEVANVPTLAETDTVEPRKIPDADVSYILQNQVAWLNYKEPIPEKITVKKEKLKLLNDLVAVNFKKVIELISKFPAVPLLLFLMKRHESLIQERAFRKISYPVQDACYSKFYDVFEKFSETEADLVSSSLCIRNLIEFVACEMPVGSAMVNDDDVDRMLAHINELINYGAISDTVNFEISSPEIGILPSGRIGIDRDTMIDFRHDIHREDFDYYKSSFNSNFEKVEKPKPKTDAKTDTYFDRVDDVFMQEWGITIWNVAGACDWLCYKLLENEKSVDLVPVEKIYEMLKEGLSIQEIDSLLAVLTFAKRDGVLSVDPKELHEVYPWRYNRRISFLLRPMIKVAINETPFYVLSARHLYSAGQNIVSRFLDGTLKVGTQYLKITNLLAERNHIKGKQFRDHVMEWLEEETSLQVVPHEVKIKPKGFFVADTDKGDIDILAIDHENKIIYAIECKNTSQAKIAYDIYNEISNYIGLNGKEGMIAKHIKRDAWLKDNIEQVSSVLKLAGDYKIKSFVLTKFIMPTKYVKDVPMPVFALSDLKAQKVFNQLN